MKLISWNVNGLRACLGKGFHDYFDQIGADAFCIQETKMMQGQAEFAPEGYEQYWNSAEKKGYSGTAVFTRMHPLTVTYGIGVDEHDHEGRVITLEFPQFYLVTVYTPNSQRELTRLSYRMTWEDAFADYLCKLDQQKPVVVCGDMNTAHPSSTPTVQRKPIIICGDLNVAATPLDLKNPEANRHNAGFTDEERERFSRLLDLGFVDTFRHLHPDTAEYSWWSYMRQSRARNIGWRIDYFLISDFAKDKIKEAKIMTDIYGSDHAPILLDVDL